LDNLTHSLVGAVLGQMGLKRKTGLAMPTLIIAANIPDIDAVAVLLGGHQHLAIRRGITHGPIAMVLLPLLLWGIMLWFDRWQERRGKRPEKRLPLHKGWLLALAYIGCLSHPALDWLNVYGIRLLEPFSSQWFYGDTLFIIDVWIWTALIIGVWISLRREKQNANWQRPAWISFIAVCGYIFLNGAITGIAEKQVRAEIVKDDTYERSGLTVVASPVPFNFLMREILWRDDSNYGSGTYVIGDQYLAVDFYGSSHRIDEVTISNIKKQLKDASPYLFWSRMPVVQTMIPTPIVYDQRFTDPRAGDKFTLQDEKAVTP
jgi:inner membrane protein